jgi:hypothetical protein
MAWPGNTDKMRGLFLKGFKLSNQGNYEDPTYLGFKIVVDFGNGGIDPEFGTPTSPLFNPSSYTGSGFAASNPFGQSQYSIRPNGNVIFYSAQSYLQEREGNFDLGPGVVNRNKRADAIAQFSKSFRDLLENYPWFIQSIDGLDELTKVKRGGYTSAAGYSEFDPSRTKGKVLTFNCLESLNLRMLALSELYKQATFDPDYMRDLVPRNLRRFRMYIFVTEIRNFFKTSRLIANSTTLSTLNNVSGLLSNAVSSSSSADDANSFNSAGGFGANTGKLGKITSDLGVGDLASTFRDQSDQAGIKPVLIIRCDDCEFDFDESTSIPSKIDNGSDTANAASFTFKVHVQRVRTKYQFPNIRTDGQFLILKDGFDQNGSSLESIANNNPLNEKSGAASLLGGALNNLSSNPAVNNALEAAGNQLTNLVAGAVNDMINEGIADFIQPALNGIDQTLLGNVYNSIGGPDSFVGQAVFNSAQSILEQNGLGNAVNLLGSNSANDAFSGNLPNSQTLGFGGPPERVYPGPGGNRDLYTRVPGQDLGVNSDASISRVYPQVSAGDSYPNVPGGDLGVPDRVYPQPNGDFYVEVPGADLGVPGRVYPPPAGVTDAYSGVPGQDLGVPDRVYPSPAGVTDVYDGVPGQDLGVPDRVYPEPDGDVYATVPGEDLGVPDRVYPGPNEDVYTTVPGQDLGVPDRVYSGPNDDVYANVPGQDLGVPDRVYQSFNDKVYPDAEPSANSNFSDRVYPDASFTPNQAFSDRVYSDPETPEISYQKNNRPTSAPGPIYPKISPPQISRGELGKAYPKTAEDFVIEKAIEQTTLDLGNMKPEDKYNVSLGQFNPDENKFED